MPRVDLSRCPDCRYYLTGLPTRHRCPECGFEYDEFTIVWESGHRWFHYAAYFCVLIWPTIILVKIIVQLLRHRVPSSIDAIGVSVCLPLALSGLLILRRIDQRGRFAAVSPKGLFVRDVAKTRHVPWSELDVDAMRRGLSFTRGGIAGIWRTFMNVLDSRSDRADFMEAAERAMAMYASRNVAPSESAPSRSDDNVA